jgi:hypothetical protein
MALAAQKEVDKKTQKLQLTYQVNFVFNYNAINLC